MRRGNWGRRGLTVKLGGLLGAIGGAFGTVGMGAVAFLELALLGGQWGVQGGIIEAAFGGPSLALPVGWPPWGQHFLHGIGLGAVVGAFGFLMERAVLSSWRRVVGAGAVLGGVLWLLVVATGGPAPSGPGSQFYLFPISLSMHLTYGVTLFVTLMVASRSIPDAQARPISGSESPGPP